MKVYTVVTDTSSVDLDIVYHLKNRPLSILPALIRYFRTDWHPGCLGIAWQHTVQQFFDWSLLAPGLKNQRYNLAANKPGMLEYS